jgi:hypothetical protein
LIPIKGDCHHDFSQQVMVVAALCHSVLQPSIIAVVIVGFDDLMYFVKKSDWWFIIEVEGFLRKVMSIVGGRPLESHT